MQFFSYYSPMWCLPDYTIHIVTKNETFCSKTDLNGFPCTTALSLATRGLSAPFNSCRCKIKRPQKSFNFDFLYLLFSSDAPLCHSEARRKRLRASDDNLYPERLKSQSGAFWCKIQGCMFIDGMSCNKYCIDDVNTKWYNEPYQIERETKI